MSTYPRVWIDNIECDDPTFGRYGLHPEHPPRITNMPGIQSVTVPGRDGSLWTPQGTHPSPLFTIVMVLSGTGASKDLQYADLENMVDMWGAIAARPRVQLAHQMSNAGIRYNDARVVSFDVERTSLDWAKLTMVFECVAPFWADQPSGSITGVWTQASPAASVYYTVTTFAGATAPLQDVQILITGNASTVNPGVYDQGSGDFIRYGGTVPSGQALRIDVGTLRAFYGPTATVTMASGVAGTEVSSLISVGGNGAYIANTFRLTPAPPNFGALPSTWVVKAGLSVPAASLSIQGRRGYR